MHRTNFNLPGHAHELAFSCYRKYAFLKADRACQWFADAVSAARDRWHFDVWAYVLMPDHVHIIIRPRDVEYDVARIRSAIKEPVSKAAIRFLEQSAPGWLPRITRKRGSRTERHFWQSGGGYDRNITEGTTLIKMIDYIHLNPVRRGFVERAADWKWSSAAWYVAQREPPIPLDPIPPEWLV